MRTPLHATTTGACVVAAVIVAVATVGCSASPTVDAEGPPSTSASGEVAVEPIAGLGTVALTTPTSGGGDRPLFVWEPTSGAADYVVTVRDAVGDPYWSWVGTETQVRLGLLERPASAPGPRVTAGMTWDVVARDVDGVPVAVSAPREIAP